MNKDQYIEDLERYIATLEGQPNQPEVAGHHVGRLVMCRHYSSEPWQGPLVLTGVLDERIGERFTVLGGRFRQAKLYTGPTRPNWIEHDGRGRPSVQDVSDDIVVQRRDGLIDLAKVDTVGWLHNGRGSDIMRYTIIEP